MTTTRVAVIGDDMTQPQELSGVTEALVRAGYAVQRLTIDDAGSVSDAAGQAVELACAVAALRSCVAALLMPFGHDAGQRVRMALCELAGVPHVGSPPRAAAIAADTWATRLIGEALGIRVANGVLVTRANAHHVAGLLCADLPLMVRPVAPTWQGSVARTHEELAAGLEAGFLLDDRVLVDQVVDGPSIAVAVLGRADGTRIVAPALEVAVPAQRLKELEVAAVTMYDALGCAGFAHVGFFLTGAGPVLNGVDPWPACGPRSSAVRALAGAGVAYEALLDMVVRDAAQAAGRRPVVAR
jgi:D-alanine-D-alanine ligase